MTESIPIGDIIAITLLVITIVVIFLVSFLDRKADINHKKKIACKSIKQEIQDARLAFKEDGEYELVSRGDNVSYRLAYLYTDAFDSLINSGIYLEFSTKVQNELSGFYNAVKRRNATMRDLTRYYDTFFMNDTSAKRRERWNAERTTFEIGITDHEKYIRERLDFIEKLMDEETP